MDYNARSKAEVDQIIHNLEVKGVEIVRQTQKVFQGEYNSYFVDPDRFPLGTGLHPFFSI